MGSGFLGSTEGVGEGSGFLGSTEGVGEGSGLGAWFAPASTPKPCCTTTQAPSFIAPPSSSTWLKYRRPTTALSGWPCSAAKRVG